MSLFTIPVGVGLFIAGVFLENKYAQSLGIAIPVVFEMLSRVISIRKTNYDFQINYHKYSKDVVKIIKDGFGEKSGILGDCIDENGIIDIKRPQEPDIKDIELARRHLQYGYPDYWKLKEKAVSESEEILEKIQRIKNNFESRVVNEIEQATEKSHTTLVRKNNYLLSRDEVFQSCYYDDLITEIFYKIKIRKQNKRPRQLYPGFSWINNEADEQGVSVYELSFGQNGKKLVRIREEDKDEIKSCIEKLLSNSDLNKMVSDYITLKDELDKNKNRSDFFQNIDNLYKKIYSDGEPLNRKGKCTLCPFELY